MDRENRTEKRKSEHIDIVLNREVTGKRITTGFERYRFRHEALPEISFSQISLKTTFLGKPQRTPFLISSMTGGTKRARLINFHLAEAAQARGWAMGLGSMRAALEHPEIADTFQVRRYAPDIPLFTNLGAVQLNYGYGTDHCKRIVELAEADGLILHLNSMQEVFQPEGDTDFRHLFRRIEDVCRTLGVPVGVKEVGWGIHGELARRLYEAGVAFVDVAGAGGTSWSQVEKFRSRDELATAAAEAFTDWGLPTADCILDVRRHAPDSPLIASGGVMHGVDGAKALALGADMAGFGRSLLQAADSDSPEAIARQLERIEREFQIAMFGIGVSQIDELKGTERMIRIE
ncbi:type 2 isopentenyl-diphosphate Delta-isomerase [Salinithrix halophila]|uniref:Isopentenyl-diphosphate delta-isomerase n=1 Tax=Salinithrix halophila TaxID=1485204 RepID=A0ABV8JA92_9BACL